MEVYLVFIGYAYYPSGFSDYKGSSPSLEGAMDIVKTKKEEEEHVMSFDWFEIVKVTQSGAELVKFGTL